MPANTSSLLVIERILRDRDGIWQQIVAERELNRLTGQMLASSAVALAVFGAVLGSFHSVWMAMTSAVKLPLLFLVTLAICLPTLYLFNLVFGARLSVRQALALVMVAITVTSMLSLAFAPISLFFLITAQDYDFFKLLNVGILTLTAFVGLRFLVSGMHALNAHQEQEPALVAPVAPEPEPEPELVPVGAAAEPSPDGAGGAPTDRPGASGSAAAHGHVALPAQARAVSSYPLGRPLPQPVAAAEKPASMGLLYIWILLFGFVGTQLAWTLRPFFGSPDQEFALFRQIEGNFYAQIFQTIGNLF